LTKSISLVTMWKREWRKLRAWRVYSQPSIPVSRTYTTRPAIALTFSSRSHERRWWKKKLHEKAKFNKQHGRKLNWKFNEITRKILCIQLKLELEKNIRNQFSCLLIHHFSSLCFHVFHILSKPFHTHQLVVVAHPLAFYLRIHVICLSSSTFLPFHLYIPR
jgi:hypothetical protein